jgi:hypothetical protein
MDRTFPALALLVLTASSCSGGKDPTADGEPLQTDGVATTDTDTGIDGTDTGTLDTGTGPTQPPPGLRLNHLRAKSSHNSYERDEALFDQLVFHRVRSVELDIHVDKGGDWPPVAGDWYVHHAGAGDPTTCHRLSDCLVELGAFHDAVPEHELVTVFVDLKTGFDDGTGHGPADLDARIRARFGDDALLTPASLLAACPGATDLRDAVTGGCGWPTIEEARGRLAFVLTGGSSCATDTELSSYVDGGAAAGERVGFVAPTPDGARCTLDALIDQHREVVIANLPPEDAADAAVAGEAGLLARVWGLESSAAWDGAVAAGVHFLATDQVNVSQDPWSTTAGPGGWPFACIDAGCGAPDAETDDVFGFEVTSGDQWGSADDMALLYDDVGTGATEHTAFASVSSSHVEPFAKGCLVARASDAADAASFAVCRPADQHPIRAQIRAGSGQSTSAVEVPINAPDTVDDESAAFLRMTVEPDGGGAVARGYASQDGVSWVLLAEQAYTEALPVQGIGVSGHDSADPVRILFGGVVRTVDGATSGLSLQDLPSTVLFGGASVTTFTGPVP